MFQYSPLAFSIIVTEILLSLVQFFIFLARPADRSRRRFLLLIASFLLFNICAGIMPNESFQLPLLLQNTIIYGVGIWLACHYFYYLVVELDMIQIGAFTVKTLAISLTLSFVTIYFTTYFITKDFEVARKVFIGIPFLIGIYFCFKTVQFLVRKWRDLNDTNTPYGTILIASNIGIIFMATMPITDYYGNLDINILTVNVSLFVSTYAYLRNYLYQSRLEFEFLTQIGFYKEQNAKEKELIMSKFREFNLTSRELDVALLILEGKPYKEIGDRMFISPKTVSKHASNIFKKTNTSKKDDFLDQFLMDKSK